MKNLFKISFIISLLLILNSCKKKFEIDPDQIEESIVISSIINQKDSISVAVTKSFDPYKENILVEELKNATVSIYEDDVFLENLIYSTNTFEHVGTFKSSFVPDVSKTYKVEIDDPVMGKASAVAKIPNDEVSISNSNAQLISSSGEIERFNFSFDINDPVGKNYYYLKLYFPIYKRNSAGQLKPFRDQLVELLSSSLPNTQRYLDNGFVFTDESFDESSITISGIGRSYHGFDGFDFGEGNNIELDMSKVYIRLEILSEDAYNYYSSHATALRSNSGALVEPSIIFENIENGLGIFVGMKKMDVPVEVE